MGGDGGSIPTRIELVRTKKRDERLAKEIEDAIKWAACALSQEKLREPIVADELGRLYNKSAILEWLLDKNSKQPPNGEASVAKNIRSLKDVKELQLTKNPIYDEKLAGREYKDFNIAAFICPVVGVEMNGKSRFSFIWTCGCAFSERAIKEVKSAESVCPKCSVPFAPDDLIVLNPSDDEIEEMRTRMAVRREHRQKAAKAKRTSKANDESTSAEPSTSAPKRKAATTWQQPASKMPKEAAAGSSIQSDPRASKTFKSLFTTSEAGKNAPRAHWVTFNPQYF